MWGPLKGKCEATGPCSQGGPQERGWGHETLEGNLGKCNHIWEHTTGHPELAGLGWGEPPEPAFYGEASWLGRGEVPTWGGE